MAPVPVMLSDPSWKVHDTFSPQVPLEAEESSLAPSDRMQSTAAATINAINIFPEGMRPRGGHSGLGYILRNRLRDDIMVSGVKVPSHDLRGAFPIPLRHRV